MKSKLTMMLCLLVMTGTMLWTETLQAEDYGIQKTRRKIWNLLKEERPDYYGEQRDAGRQQLAMNTANYHDVKLSPSNLVEEQNDFIASSLQKEEIDIAMAWPLDSGRDFVAEEDPIRPEIAAAVEKQVAAAIKLDDQLAKAVPTDRIDLVRPEKPEPLSVTADQKSDVEEKTVTTVQPKGAVVVEDAAPEDVIAPDVAPAPVQEAVHAAGTPQDEDAVTQADADDEAISEKKSFLAGLKSMFKRKNKASTEDAPVAEEMGAMETAAEDAAAEDVRKYQAMREILNDKDLEQVSSQARKPAGVEQEIVYTEKPDVKELAGVAEELPKEIKLVKVSPQPLESLPNPVVLEEAPSAEDADMVMMNQGVIYQDDVPERAPEEIEVQNIKTKSKKMVETSEAMVKTDKVSDGSLDEGFMALRANMQEAEAVPAEAVAAVKQETAVEESAEEDLMTKFRRKISPGGMLKEEVAELEYWNVPVEAQTIDDISRNLKIEQAMKEAANITLQEEPSLSIKERYRQQKTMVVSPEDIVRQAIPVKNRDKRIDLDFDNTNLSDILLIMGEAGDMNIMLDPALKSNILDLHLKQISLEDALLLIANSYDLGFKLVGQALFITEKDKLKFENKVSRIIKVRNVNVQEAKQLVEDLADKVNISEELNSLIVIGDPQDVAQVENLVAMIDNPQPQVILEAKIIEVNKDALRDLGVDWSDQINVLYQESGRPQEFDDVENSTGGIYRIAQIQRNALQFEATIRMLEQQNKAKVLSAPRVSTLNGKEAEIFVGDQVPYTITNITGGVVTNDVRFVEPGIRLKITPSIIEDNFVVMKVEPEVSFIVAFRGPNDEFPQVRTREATAHVRVENKQPFVLGGILNQEDKQSLFKVPFFGNLPLFGNLFSYEKNTAVDTELIITVIPTIVHGRD